MHPLFDKTIITNYMIEQDDIDLIIATSFG